MPNLFGHVPVMEVQVADVLAFHAKCCEQTKEIAAKHWTVVGIHYGAEAVRLRLNDGSSIEFPIEENVPIYAREDVKIPDALVAQLRATVAPLDTEDTRAGYLDGRYAKSGAVKDLDKRYRWDLFYAARAWLLFDREDFLDSHIDTALRAIVPPLKKKDGQK